MTFTDIKFNREELRDKIYGCWMGKNIGGTMGAPFEGTHDMLDISGYTTPKGEPLPNDDLDLQLIWLRALEHVGPFTMNINTLGYHWLRYIPASWNEYGIGKANMRMGLLPPMSGEVNNEAWRNSNGAWIRSEIWACLAPGFPNVAIHYAIMDACIDHGVSEGTVAEIFTACLESLAFFETDVRTVIEKALSRIPENSRIAQDVRLVMAEYDKGTPYREVRQMIVEHDKDLGWFQAPANIAYTVIGLLYGEGDFKQSLICAINCGDDTDCTGATCGAVLGIMKGYKAIPDELKEYIGDRIITMSLDNCFEGRNQIKTCTQLTDRVMKMIPTVLFANEVYCEYTDGPTEIDLEKAADLRPISHTSAPVRYDLTFLDRPRFSFDIDSRDMHAMVSYEKEPRITPLGELKVRVDLKSLIFDPHWENVDVSLPEGWSCDCPRTVYIPSKTPNTEAVAALEFTITAGERVDSVNRATVSLSAHTHPQAFILPLTILG